MANFVGFCDKLDYHAGGVPSEGNDFSGQLQRLKKLKNILCNGPRDFKGGFGDFYKLF